MAILSRPKISPQQRFDLEDFTALLSSLRTDSLLWTRSFQASTNLIVSGFNITGIGLSSALVNMSNAAFLIPQSTTDFSYFISAPAEPNITIPDADLTDNARNFVELELVTEENTPLTKAFWDPEANSGNGAEFNQIVNTMTDLKVQVVVSTAGFSGSPDRLPLAIIDTDINGTIKVILDRRDLFGRLAKPNDLDNEYNWGTKQEPLYQLNMTGVVGVFVAGETITIGGETAKVVNGGGAAITFAEPTGINFGNGDSVVGGTSGATGTVDTISESFSGVDKSLATQKQINDALMTEIKKIKDTRFWWQDAGTSLIGLSDFLNAVLVQAVADTLFKWDGSNLYITNGALNPSASDVMAYLRQMGKNTNMALARQDDGKEIQKITFDLVPSAGTFTLEQNGDISDPINWNDDAAAVEAACNANFANQVSVEGNFTVGFTITFDSPGPQVAITEDSNTLTNGGNPVVITVTTVKNGLAGITAIPIADGEVLFIKVPDVGSRTFSGVGSGDTNYQVVPLEDFENIDGNYWLAYSENGLVYIRNFGELQAGEESPISDPDKETILGLIAASTARANQDRVMKMIEGGTWSLNLDGDELTLSADAYMSIPGISQARNTIDAQTISLPNPTSVAYIKILRDDGIPVVRPVQVNDEADIVLDDDTKIIARKVADGVLVGESFLLQPGELLTLDGALAEINRYFGQLRLVPHPTDSDRVKVTGVDVTKLNQTKLAQALRNLLLVFSGAEIDVETGEIFEDDGITPLGIDFVPPTVAASQYRWLSVTLLPSTVNANNTINGQLLVLVGATDGATPDLAPRAAFANGIQLGQFYIQRNAGDTEFEPISFANISQLGVGSGSGGGGGAGDSLMSTLKDRLALSPYTFVSPNVFKLDGDDKIGMASTGTFSPADETFEFAAPGDTLVSTELLDPDFLDDAEDVVEAEIVFQWVLDAIDTAATYELSRDGGANWQAVTMSRIGLTDTYTGRLTFADEPTYADGFANASNVAPGVLTDDLGADPFLSDSFTVVDAITLKTLKLSVTKNNDAVGGFYAQIVTDDLGSPSTDPNDVLWESSVQSIDALSLGANAIELPMTLALAAGVYHVVVQTTSEYKAQYTLDNTDTISVPVDGSGDVNYELDGRELSLLMRVTSSVGDVQAEGYGVLYAPQVGPMPVGIDKQVQYFNFSLDDVSIPNIPLDFIGDEEIVEVYDILRGQCYVADSDTFRIVDNEIVFALGFWDDSIANDDERQVRLKIVQIEGNGFDNADQNAANIAEIFNQLEDIGDQLDSISDSMVIPKVAAPFTSVQNRALMYDLSMDLSCRQGFEPYCVSEVYHLPEERGPNGEQIYGVVNDHQGMVRLGGIWESHLTTNGPKASSVDNLAGQFMEITFYGTGINILTSYSAIASDWRLSLDGGPEGANIFPAPATVLNGLTYTANYIFPVVSGLDLDWHTIKIRKAGTDGHDLHLFGYQVITQISSGQIRVNPGAMLHKGKRRIHSLAESFDALSGFDSGSLSTHGGQVVIYQNEDGSIGRAANPASTSQLNLTAADHSNEEEIRAPDWREFGVGRTGDVASLDTNVADNGFVLNDGSTAMSAFQCRAFNIKSIQINNTTGFILINFMGTGLDIVDNFGSATAETMAVSVDEVSVGTFNNASGATFHTRRKIVSGLPFGSHSVKISFSAGSLNGDHGVSRFIVYGPKRPTIPADAVEIASYFALANYSNATATGALISDNAQNPTGVINKNAVKEWTYTGAGWNINSNEFHPGRFNLSTNTNAEFAEHSFYGTGFVLHMIADSATYDYTVHVNGALNASGVAVVNASNLGGGSYRSTSTAINRPSRVEFTGLTLGLYRVRITKTAGTTLRFLGYDVITPIMGYKRNGPIVANSQIDVGSAALTDKRVFSSKDQNKVQESHSQGTITDPSNALTTNVRIPQMFASIRMEKDAYVDIEYAISLQQTTAGAVCRTQVYVNGEQVGKDKVALQGPSAGTINTTVTDKITVFLGKGDHLVAVTSRTTAGTVTFLQDNRVLSVKVRNR